MKHFLLVAMLVVSVIGCKSQQYNVDFKQAVSKKKSSKSQNIQEVKDFLVGIEDAAAENQYLINYRSKVVDNVNDLKSYDELLKAKENVLLSFIRIDNYKDKFSGMQSYKTAMIYVTVSPDDIKVSFTSQSAMKKQCEDAYRDLRDKMQEYIDSGLVTIKRTPELKMYY